MEKPGFHRQVRVYARDASAGHVPRLSATSEGLPGLEAALAWRPSGNVIASLVRYGYEGGGEGRKGRWDVAMLERNGLRHGGFELREAEKVWADGYIHDMAWNADSEVLAIWIRKEKEDVGKCGQRKPLTCSPTLDDEELSLLPQARDRAPFQRVPFCQHAVAPGACNAAVPCQRQWVTGTPNTDPAEHVQARTFVWDTYAAHLPMPNDTATVAVVDGSKLSPFPKLTADQLLMTPFRTQNVPPPMSSYKLVLPEQVVHVSISPVEDALAVLFSSGLVQVWDLGTRLPEAGQSRLRGGGKPAEPKLRWEQRAAPEGHFIAKQVCLSGNGDVAALFWTSDDALLRIANANEVRAETCLLQCSQHVLWEEQAGWVIAERDGVLRGVDESKPLLVDICRRPQVVIISAESRLAFALSDMGKLCAASLNGRESVTLASQVTSITTTSEFLIYTTSAQSSHYAPLDSIQRILDGEDVTLVREEEWDQRRVERGALAVVACPSSMSLVLQMPRGNLETVYPRALVLSVVRRDILSWVITWY